MKAMKASDISPAMISAMGVPMSALGHTAGVQPFADARHEDEREHEAEARRHRVEQRGGQVVLLALHEDGHAHHQAQLVVMSGRKMPSAEYSGGIAFLRNISTNCTKPAITRMNTMVCK